MELFSIRIQRTFQLVSTCYHPLFKRKERMFPIIWIGKYMDYIIR